MSQASILPPYQLLKLPGQHEIAYLETGKPNAPVLLFLHGLSDSAEIWDQSLSILQTHFRCIAIDLPGHGHTKTADFEYKMYAYADVVETFIKKLKISSFSLVGHSMGGQISIILGLRLPAMVQKLILVAPAGFEQFTEYEKNMLLLGASYGNSWSKNSGTTMKDVGARQDTMQKCMKGMLSEPVFDFLPQLTVPTLIIFCDQDAFIPNRYLHPNLTTAAIARDGGSQIPDAEIKLFPRCSHYPHIEQPSLFVDSVVSFLKKGL